MKNKKIVDEKYEPLQFLGAADLVKRWCYSKQGVHNLIRDKETFPKPYGAINNGRNKFWNLADIIAYENNHPEVINEQKKEQKIRYYAWLAGNKS
jgi:hypothetical protein